MTTKAWTAKQYRALRLTAPNGDGPWALEANPDHNYSTSRHWRTTGQTYGIYGIVMHITAGLTDYTLPDVSAESTTRYGATMTRDASWHVCIDSDTIIPSVRDTYRAWHAGVSGYAFNHGTLGVEIGTGSPNWTAKPGDWVTRTLTNVAVWAAPRVVRHGIPLKVIRDRKAVQRAILARRPFGFAGHHVLDPGRRSDPGLHARIDTFPWDRFFDLIRTEIKRLTTTTDWSDMATKDEIKAAIREVLAEEATARAILTGHRIMVDPTDPAGQRVAPSRVIELGAASAVRAAERAGVNVTAIRDAIAAAVDDIDITATIKE